MDLNAFLVPIILEYPSLSPKIILLVSNLRVPYK